MPHKISKFLKLDAPEKKLLLEAYSTLGLSRFQLLTSPFKSIVEPLNQVGSQSEIPSLSESDNLTAIAIGDAIRKSANHTPWESACLVQTLAAQKMLSKRNIPGILYIGATQNTRMNVGLHAHAWLTSGSQIITGEDGHMQFSVLASFSWE